MLYLKKVIYCLAVLIMLTGCNGGNTVIKTISSDDAKAMMDTRTDITIIDVREQNEYDSGHIKNAILLPLGSIEQEAKKTLPDKASTVLLYCRTGRRSASAAKKLEALGYTDIYDFGGITDWQYEIE
ncbi:MAG: rhodanese-like domain-containing protein [Oscillospiraceae bacterium]